MGFVYGSVLLDGENSKYNFDVKTGLLSVNVGDIAPGESKALFNISDNAVKYTPADGDIQVSVQSWEFYVKIDITDSGNGIAESRQGIIFKRFYREKEIHDIEGIGIGLYLAREIITMQGGYIKVTSMVGYGSTFSVFLPRG